MSLQNKVMYRMWVVMLLPHVTSQMVQQVQQQLPIENQMQAIYQDRVYLFTGRFDDIKTSKALHQQVRAQLHTISRPIYPPLKQFYASLGQFVSQRHAQFYYESWFQQQSRHYVFKDVCVMLRGKKPAHFFLDSLGAIVQVDCTPAQRQMIAKIWVNSLQPTIRKIYQMVYGRPIAKKH